jgi:hypothetical protein
MIMPQRELPMKCHNGMRQTNILIAAVMLATLFKCGIAFAQRGLGQFL